MLKLKKNLDGSGNTSLPLPQCQFPSYAPYWKSVTIIYIRCSIPAIKFGCFRLKNKRPVTIVWPECQTVKVKGQGHQTRPRLKGLISLKFLPLLDIETNVYKVDRQTDKQKDSIINKQTRVANEILPKE